jgi:hypothetical protein
MKHSTLYDNDIVLWSEQQAAVIRQLGRRRDLPNELDIENVAEEIESVGRSELAAVKSYLRLIFIHLLKLSVETEARSAAHWRGEIVGFHSEMIERYAPSMRQRIDLDAIWRSSREQLMLACEDDQQRALVAAVAMRCPFDFDELLGDRIDLASLNERLRAVGGPQSR